MNKLVPVCIALFICSLSQAQIDSTAIKNKRIIEDLKHRINTIDNIGKGKTASELELDAMRLLVKQQNDSILKLNALLANYAKVLNEAPIEGLNKSSSFSSLSSYDVELTKNDIVFLYKKNETEFNTNFDAVLEKLRQKLINNPKLRIRIEGHADKTGSEEVNVSLSKARAENVKKYIVSNTNATSSLISVKWFGSSKPCSQNGDLNRRVEVIVENVK